MLDEHGDHVDLQQDLELLLLSSETEKHLLQLMQICLPNSKAFDLLISMLLYEERQNQLETLAEFLLSQLNGKEDGHFLIPTIVHILGKCAPIRIQLLHKAVEAFMRDGKSFLEQLNHVKFDAGMKEIQIIVMTLSTCLENKGSEQLRELICHLEGEQTMSTIAVFLSIMEKILPPLSSSLQSILQWICKFQCLHNFKHFPFGSLAIVMHCTFNEEFECPRCEMKRKQIMIGKGFNRRLEMEPAWKQVSMVFQNRNIKDEVELKETFIFLNHIRVGKLWGNRQMWEEKLKQLCRRASISKEEDQSFLLLLLMMIEFREEPSTKQLIINLIRRKLTVKNSGQLGRALREMGVRMRLKEEEVAGMRESVCGGMRSLEEKVKACQG